MNLLLMFIKCLSHFSLLCLWWKQPELPRIIISFTACFFVLIKQKFHIMPQYGAILDSLSHTWRNTTAMSMVGDNWRTTLNTSHAHPIRL
jgi:hypothetical protein